MVKTDWETVLIMLIKQNRVDQIAQWASDWRMEINPSKSKIIHLGRNNPGLTYSINGMPIQSVATEKDVAPIEQPL